jgi:hypothetical protein
MRILTLALILLLAGCWLKQPPTVLLPDAPKPVPALCAAECLTPCIPDPWPQWTHDADDVRAWDALGREVLLPLRAAVQVCDASRAACVACLRRLETVGLVCGVSRSCPLW